MDLPVNFPPGTRFWRLIIDAVADVTTGEFMLLDGSIVAVISAPMRSCPLKRMRAFSSTDEDDGFPMS
jgi:hypothetical protein